MIFLGAPSFSQFLSKLIFNFFTMGLYEDKKVRVIDLGTGDKVKLQVWVEIVKTKGRREKS